MAQIIGLGGQKNNEFAAWDITKKYRAGDLAVYTGSIYEANDDIPENTPWATGISGATWAETVAGGGGGYGDGNVVTLMSAFGSNSITTTGDVSVGNITVGSVSTLGVVGNVKITGGSNGQVLRTDGNGNLTWSFSAPLAQGLIVNTTDTTANLQVLFTNGSGGLVDAQSTQLMYQASSNKLTVSNVAANGTVEMGNGTVAGFAVGYRDVPQVTASNTTLALTDAGKHYYSTTAGNLTLTIPTNASVAFATGTAITIVVQAAGNVLVNAASGVTLYMGGNSTAGNRVVGTYGMASLLKVASDTWFINGAGVA
jgi:hypothetical protein